MILLREKKLKLKFVKELGIDHIRKASLQKKHHFKKLQLTFMVQGTLSWKFSDGRTIRLQGGEYCLTQPGDKIEVLNDVLSPCYLIWILLDPFIAEAEKGSCFSKDDLTEMGDVLTKAGNPVLKISVAMAFHLKEIRELLHSNDSGKVTFEAMHKIRLSLMSIFVESAGMMRAGNIPANGLPVIRLAKQVRELVLKQPGRNFSAEEIGGFFNLSVGLFSKKFKKDTGISLADFVRRVKLEESLRLMGEKSKNITEIAHHLGFSSSQYFATLFKKYFGKTPKEFRILRA